MKNMDMKRKEQVLRDIYLHQKFDSSSPGWEESVMNSIRQTAIADVSDILQKRVAFECAWVAAAAAALAIIVGITLGPRNIELAWQITQDSALSSWALTFER